MKNLHLKSTLSMAIAVALTACSGGGDGTSLGGNFPNAGGVISGVDSGSISSGTVTRFGSVFVNGVEFETHNSSFDIDGTPGVQADLDVGMVVEVAGSINADGITGTATSISFNEQIQGPVSGLSLPSADGSTRVFSVLGTNVSISSMDTVFDVTGEGTVPAGTPFGFDEIALGNNVEISGFFDSSGVLNATRVELQNISFDAVSIVELHGEITALGNTSFTIDGVSVDASSATINDLPFGLENGVLVEVNGTFNVATNTLFATTVGANSSSSSSSSSNSNDSSYKVSIEGLITDFTDNASFNLNGQAVDASAAVMVPGTLTLANDLRVEAEGHIVDGVLQAIKLELRAGQERVHALVSSVDVEHASFTLEPVVGQPEIEVMVTPSTEMKNQVTKNRQFALIDLAIGDFVEVRGFADGTVITANRVRVRTNRDVVVQGARQADATPGFIKVLGVEFAIAAAGETSFENSSGVHMSQGEFDLAVDGSVNNLVKIKDSEVSDNSGIGNGIADVAEVHTSSSASSTPPGTVPPETTPPPATTPPPETTPPPVVDPLLANFTGTVADLAGLSALFTNVSREGRARLDINIRNVPRQLIANTGDFFGDTGTGRGEQLDIVGVANAPGSIGVGDHISLDRFSAMFMDNHNEVRTFAQDTVVAMAQEIKDSNGDVTGARQDVVELAWSIRFADVATLVDADHVDILLDDTVLLASAEIGGDVTINDAVNVSFFNVVNSFPAVPVAPVPTP